FVARRVYVKSEFHGGELPAVGEHVGKPEIAPLIGYPCRVQLGHVGVDEIAMADLVIVAWEFIGPPQEMVAKRRQRYVFILVVNASVKLEEAFVRTALHHGSPSFFRKGIEAVGIAFNQLRTQGGCL